MGVFANISQGEAPDLLMLNLLLPGFNPRETLAEVGQSCPKSLIVIVSMNDNQATIDREVEYGVDAYVVQSTPAASMLETLVADRAGEFVIARAEAVSGGDLPRQPTVLELTKRQRDILGLLRDGRTNKEIGRSLAISPFTVRNHLSHLMRMLGVRSRFELAKKVAGIVH